MAGQNNKGGFGGSNPSAEAPSSQKVEKASGLAEVAKKILYTFMDSIAYRDLEKQIIVPITRLQKKGEETQADKDVVLDAIDVAEKRLAEGAFKDAPAGVPENYLSKLRAGVEKIEVA